MIQVFGFFALLAATTPAGRAQNQLQPTPVSSYCATGETENTQTLTDGSHLAYKTKARICRDSHGRTRGEDLCNDNVVFLDDWCRGERGTEVAPQPFLVSIIDPVAGVRIALDVRTHTEKVGLLADEHRQWNLVQPVAPSPPKPPALQARPANPRPLPQITRESLGSQMMEGVLVEGNRTTITVPAGTDGNDAPVVQIMESWESKDLGLAVLYTLTDPRFGVRIDRVTNIDRSEPDPALFRVPADYTLVAGTPEYPVNGR